jgi:hypothetical protein
MQVEQIEKLLQQIEIMCGNDEAAHSHEDELYRKVLKAIARDPSNAQDLAKAALKSSMIPEVVYINKGLIKATTPLKAKDLRPTPETPKSKWSLLKVSLIRDFDVQVPLIVEIFKTPGRWVRFPSGN